MVSQVSMEAISQVFICFTQFTRLTMENEERIWFWEDLWWGYQPLYLQNPDLYRVILVRNLSISTGLGYSPPSTLNLSF